MSADYHPDLPQAARLQKDTLRRPIGYSVVGWSRSSWRVITMGLKPHATVLCKSSLVTWLESSLRCRSYGNQRARQLALSCERSQAVN